METRNHSPIGIWSIRLAMLVPAVLLMVAGIPRLQSGLVIDAVFPVPTFMVLNAVLPEQSYRQTAELLAHANSQDGLSLIQRAEALSMAKAPPAEIVALLDDGLSKVPSSVRGWTLLAEQVQAQDRKAAAAALAHSFLLGPYEYFIAGRRARDAAVLWDLLSPDAREAAMRETRLLWSEPTLRPEIEVLLMSTGGAQLVNLAFKSQPEDLRALNRWLADRRRDAARRAA